MNEKIEPILMYPITSKSSQPTAESCRRRRLTRPGARPPNRCFFVVEVGKTGTLDKFVVDYFFELAHDPKKFKAVMTAASQATVDGSKEMKRQRKRATSRLSKLERNSTALADKLSDPSIAGLTSVKKN
ncbi:hypothetical protein OAG71_00195 [bacterium]|nr:hypothetical protein [bacterium]